MRANTVLEKRIDKICCNLPKLTEEHKKWIIGLFDKHVFATKKFYTCFECGHRWDNKSGFDNHNWKHIVSFDNICPGCGEKLKPWKVNKHKTWDGKTETHNRRVASYNVYATLCEHHHGLQVIRYFYATRDTKVLEKARYSFTEVIQHWIEPETGKRKIFTAGNNSWGYYGLPQWNYKALELRKDLSKYYPHNKLYPKKKVLPIFRKYGFKRGFNGFIPSTVLSIIVSDRLAETLWKIKQYDLLDYYIGNKTKFKEHWPSIKIVLRNKYNIKSVSCYFDYLGQLENFGKDLRSPHYLCPKNFDKAHQKYIDKARRIREKIDLEKRIAKMKEDEEKYAKKIKKYKDFTCKEDNIVISVVKSVKQLQEESDILRHCAYSSGYYNGWKDNILLTAYVDGAPMETIEIHADFTISQARGFQNKESDHHKKIVKLMNENLKLLKQYATGIIKKKKRSKHGSSQQDVLCIQTGQAVDQALFNVAV